MSSLIFKEYVDCCACNLRIKMALKATFLVLFVQGIRCYDDNNKLVAKGWYDPKTNIFYVTWTKHYGKQTDHTQHSSKENTQELSDKGAAADSHVAVVGQIENS